MRKTAGMTARVVAMTLITSLIFMGCGEIAAATETATPSPSATEAFISLELNDGLQAIEVTGPLDTVAPTEELIPQSDYTYMPDSYASDICSYLNDKRKNNGDDSTDVEVSLDSGFCADANAHAMKLAKQGVGFFTHANYSAETDSDHAFSDGKIEAEQMFESGCAFFDPIITKIGVGAVKAPDGVIYVCVLGA